MTLHLSPLTNYLLNSQLMDQQPNETFRLEPRSYQNDDPADKLYLPSLPKWENMQKKMDNDIHQLSVSSAVREREH